METTKKLTANQKEIIMQNPKVKQFDATVSKLENVGRLAGVKMACLVYTADHDGTAAAMGLASAADYLQQVRKYSKSQAMNLQRVGKFLQGNPDKALDSNGNAIGLSALVQLLESCEDEKQARKMISDGTVSALTPVKKLKKQIDTINGKAIAAESTAKDVTDGTTEKPTEKPAEKPISDPKNDPKSYIVDMAIRVPDGKGGETTFKSKNGNYALSAIVGPLETLARECTAPDAKIVVTIKPIK